MDLSIPSAWPSGAYKYRTIREGLRGADVYALQTSIGAKADGVFLSDTDEALKATQRNLGLEADGLAGPITQTAIAVTFGVASRRDHRIPIGALYGQMLQESGFLLGNSSAPRPDGARDRGVCQLNDSLHRVVDAYNVPYSIDLLAKTIRARYDEYKGFGIVKDDDRLWDLAQASWNAPGWTRILAKGGTLSHTADAHVQAYIDKVTLYRR